MGEHYVLQPHELLNCIIRSERRLYGVKAISESGIRYIVVCKSIEIAISICNYLKKHRDLFFSFADTLDEKDLIEKREFYIVTDLNDHLDSAKFVSVYASQLDDMKSFFRRYIKKDCFNNQIVEIEIINSKYIRHVCD